GDVYESGKEGDQPAGMTPAALEAGYWRAYKDFYRWGSILRGAATKDQITDRLRHVAYAAGWKKFEPLWDWIIRARRVSRMLPMLEAILTGFGAHAPDRVRRGETLPIAKIET